MFLPLPCTVPLRRITPSYCNTPFTSPLLHTLTASWYSTLSIWQLLDTDTSYRENAPATSIRCVCVCVCVCVCFAIFWELLSTNTHLPIFLQRHTDRNNINAFTWCVLQVVSRRGEGGTTEYHVEGEINAVYTSILANAICPHHLPARWGCERASTSCVHRLEWAWDGMCSVAKVGRWWCVRKVRVIYTCSSSISP